MISVLITASEDARALARLLTALVPAAADGLVREVSVIGATGASWDIADDAGAHLFEAGGFGAAAAAARGPWIAGLPVNAQLSADWMETVAAHLAQASPPPARLTAKGFALNAGPEGWLAPKRLSPASAVVVEQDFQRLARGSGRRLRILDRG